MNASTDGSPRTVMEASMVQLPDPSESSDNDSDDDQGESPPPSKRPRSNDISFDDEESSSSRPSTTIHWDTFVQSGAKLKALTTSILGAMRKKDDVHSIELKTREQLVNDALTKSKPSNFVDENAAKVAHDKTAECMILERKLKEIQVHESALLAANMSLRESGNAANERLERTIEALRQAGSNATKARADADAAEAYATSLASQLESLRHLVDETKRATKIVQDEHEQVEAATRAVESKLLMRETELLHLHKDRKGIALDLENYKKRVNDLSNENSRLAIYLESARQQVKSLGRQLEDRDELDQSRKDRSAVVEKELRDARSLLVLASTAAVEAETTTAELKNIIETFVEENKSLHAKIEEIQQRSRDNEERLEESLIKSENCAQNLRLKAASHDEHVNQLLSEKAGYEKQINHLKGRISSLETRLRDSASFLSPAPVIRTVGGESSTETRSRKIEFSVPSLTPTAPDKSPSIAKSRQCCLCSKDACGLMRSCQCGNPLCKKRAHSTCLSSAPTSARSDTCIANPLIVLCTSTP